MTLAASASVVETPVAAQPLSLYAVTLAWNSRNDEEGDYSGTVWAANDEDAVRALAEEMSDQPAANCDDYEERADYVEALIENSTRLSSTSRVADCVLGDVEMLMAGPTNKMNEAATADLATMRAIMAKYGVV